MGHIDLDCNRRTFSPCFEGESPEFVYRSGNRGPQLKACFDPTASTVQNKREKKRKSPIKPGLSPKPSFSFYLGLGKRPLFLTPDQSIQIIQSNKRKSRAFSFSLWPYTRFDQYHVQRCLWYYTLAYSFQIINGIFLWHRTN